MNRNEFVDLQRFSSFSFRMRFDDSKPFWKRGPGFHGVQSSRLWRYIWICSEASQETTPLQSCSALNIHSNRLPTNTKLSDGRETLVSRSSEVFLERVASRWALSSWRSFLLVYLINGSRAEVAASAKLLRNGLLETRACTRACEEFAHSLIRSLWRKVDFLLPPAITLCFSHRNIVTSETCNSSLRELIFS
jgi:hypothetical protein